MTSKVPLGDVKHFTLDYTDLFFKELCPAILQAPRLENKLGNIKIVCFDDEQETLAAIKEGAIYGTVAQQPFEWLPGDPGGGLSPNRCRSVVTESKTILIPTVVIQRKDVDEYRKNLNQLVGAWVAAKISLDSPDQRA